MAGAGSIVYGKAAIEGLETSSAADASITDGTNEIAIIFGYPTATSAGIGQAVQGLDDTSEWVVVDGTGTGDGSIEYTFADSGSASTECVVTYEEPTEEGGVPTISVPDAEQC